jgi:hypothetical protein
MPMNTKLHGRVRGAYDFAIGLLGVNARYESADGTRVVAAVVGFRHLGRDDAELINAYGPGTVAITCSRRDFGDPPKKLDQFNINGAIYIVQACHHAVLNADIVGWRVYATGK